MKARTAYDVMGANEILIHCRCRASGDAYAGGVVTVMSLSTFMKLGRERALSVADEMCETCGTQVAT